MFLLGAFSHLEPDDNTSSTFFRNTLEVPPNAST